MIGAGDIIKSLSIGWLIVRARCDRAAVQSDRYNPRNSS